MRFGFRAGVAAVVILTVFVAANISPRRALADPSTDPCGSIQVLPNGTIDVTPLVTWLQSNYPDMSMDAVMQIVGDTRSLCAIQDPSLAGGAFDNGVPTGAPVPALPPTPPPGVALETGCGDSGDARCQPYVPVVTQVTNTMTEEQGGGEIHIGHTTVAFNGSGDSVFRTTMAVAVASSVGPVSVSGGCQSLVQNPEQFQLKYNGSHWPSSVQGDVFDYPPGPDFVQELDEDGWLGPGPFDLSDAPSVTTPGDVWNSQPKGYQLDQQLLNEQKTPLPSALDNVYVPGTLYVNTTLQWNQAEGTWHVIEWNYNFAVLADFVSNPPNCPIKQPPPVCPIGSAEAGQPVPADGNCNPKPQVCPNNDQPNPDGSCPGGQPPQACPDGSAPTATGWCGGQVYIPVCPPGSSMWGDPVPPDGNCNPGTPIGPNNPPQPPPPPPQLHVLLDCGDYIPCENRNVPGPPGLPTWDNPSGW